MNCESVKALLPLYVSRDLDEERVQLVSAHVHSCAACSKSAQEYNRTRDLLHEFAPPAFSDAVYSGIRENVWREIARERESKPAPLTQFVAGLFRPRFRWAVVSTLIVAAGLITFYFIANRGNDQRQLAGVQRQTSSRTPDATPASSPANTGTVPRIHRSPTRERAVPAADRAPALAETRNRQPTGSTEAALDSHKVAEPGSVQSSEKVFRLEMQTKDPNIRIIWLTPQRIKHDSPGKISKGV
ncbi:MAG TPA: zf-HC2 domain-containing protein [Pyrinomonadaceae bacterium]